MRRFLFVLLMVVAVTSACTGGGKSTTKVESKDLIQINKLDIFPGTTIRPDDSVQIRLEVENVGQIPLTLDIGSRTKGEKILYDYCKYIFKPENDQSYMEIFGSYEPKGDSHITLQPGRSIIFQWEFQAPSAEQLLGLNTECNIGTKVTYDAEAKTTTYVYFASPAEISQKVYTGEDLSQKGDNIASHGPVVVNFETPAQPIPSSTEKQRNWTAFINVKNIGAGIVKIRELNMTLPPEISPSSVSECELKPAVQPGLLSVTDETAENKAALNVGFQSTSKLACKLNAPRVDILQPYKFNSTAQYTYSVFKSTKVVVNTK